MFSNVSTSFLPSELWYSFPTDNKSRPVATNVILHKHTLRAACCFKKKCSFSLWCYLLSLLTSFFNGPPWVFNSIRCIIGQFKHNPAAFESYKIQHQLKNKDGSGRLHRWVGMRAPPAIITQPDDNIEERSLKLEFCEIREVWILKKHEKAQFRRSKWQPEICSFTVAMSWMRDCF